MEVHFEHHYQRRVMSIRFGPETVIRSAADIRELRSQWTQALQAWHSPYKALLDLSHLSIEAQEPLEHEWQRLEAYLKGFFMKAAYAYGFEEAKGHGVLPFAAFSEEEAREKSGLERQRPDAKVMGLRDAIQIQNHFQQHVMELGFARFTVLETKTDMVTLQSKISNNLMQWHSPWNLLIDCQELEIHPDQFAAFEKMLTYFKGFFMKQALGYAPRGSKESYPFTVYRARHNAAGRLEAEGMVTGSEAHCQSTKVHKKGDKV